MGTFEQDLWGIPDDVPTQVSAESVEYYKLPPGIYIAVFGRLMPKYKNQDNKFCNAEEPGAMFSHATIPQWLIESHGTATSPEKKTILGYDLKIPDRPSSELYYPLWVSWDKDDQWKNISMFGKFSLPNDPEAKVIIPSPEKPSMKIVNFKALTKYYGMQVKFNIVHSDIGNPYIDSKNMPMKIVGDRIPLDKMKAFEEQMNIKFEKERALRNANSQSAEYTPPVSDEEDSSLDDFLNG